MRRTPRKQLSTIRRLVIALDATQLSTPRGGIDITVHVAELPAAYMSPQHNELLFTDIAVRIEEPAAHWIPTQHNELLITR